MILKLEHAIDELRSHYRAKKLVPFIGAGFSIPLNLPSWKELIINLGNELGYTENLYLIHGNLQQLAEYAKLHNDKKWKSFIQKIRTEFDSKYTDERRMRSKQHIALSNLDINTIYTTNYDPHIERSFIDNSKKVKTVVSLMDLINEDEEQYDLEVIKFHGCLTDQETMILTEKQYYERMELEHPLDQKLRADVLSNSFLFIGYSFNDPNIRYIWYKIHQQLSNYKIMRGKPRVSYIVSFGSNEIQARIFKELNIKIIGLEPTDKEEQISKLINELIQ